MSNQPSNQPAAVAMTDTEILEWADKHQIGGVFSYTAAELERLLGFVKKVPAGGAVCEIGVWYGRSASVYFLENARRPREERFTIHLVDSWVLNAAEAKPTFYRMVKYFMKELPTFEYMAYWMPSQKAVEYVPRALDLLHIDGDHNQGAWDDCRLYLPKVRVGGVVVVHDYGKTDEYPEVTKAVNYYIPAFGVLGEFERLGVVDSQFAAKRIN